MASGFLFFAYGEMADEACMEKVDPLCELMGAAKAVDHRLAFTQNGDANLLPEPGASVGGTLWLVPASSMAAMDAAAETKGLSRGVVFIISPAGPKVPATVYFNPSAPEGKPTSEVLACTIAAAKTMGLDRRFQRELKTLST